MSSIERGFGCGVMSGIVACGQRRPSLTGSRTCIAAPERGSVALGSLLGLGLGLGLARGGGLALRGLRLGALLARLVLLLGAGGAPRPLAVVGHVPAASLELERGARVDLLDAAA